MTPTICDEMQERLRLHVRQFGDDVSKWPVKGLPVTLDEWFALSEAYATEKAMRTGFDPKWPEPVWVFGGVKLQLVLRVVRGITGGFAVKL